MAALLSAMLDTQVIPLELQDERFHHLDACFFSAGAGHDVRSADLSEFVKAGGGAKRLTLKIN